MEIDPATSQPVEKVRALIALGMLNHHGLVLATDSPWLASDIDGINDFADDLGLDTRGANGPGLFLWEGTAKTVCSNGPDGYEPETQYDGTIRTVTMEEVPGLLAMKAPKPEEDDREEIQPWDARYYRTPGEGGPG
jgi:hypothetical protein